MPTPVMTNNQASANDAPVWTNIPRISDPRGNLSFVECGGLIPFDIASVEWHYQIPAGASGQMHAYTENRQMLMVISGSCDVEILNISGDSTIYRLSDPAQALIIGPKTLRRFAGFSTNCVLVLLNSATELPSPL